MARKKLFATQWPRQVVAKCSSFLSGCSWRTLYGSWKQTLSSTLVYTVLCNPQWLFEAVNLSDTLRNAREVGNLQIFQGTATAVESISK